MKKQLLTLSIALASLFATTAFAQKDVAGEGRAAPAAKAKRKAAGADAAKSKKDATAAGGPAS